MRRIKYVKGNIVAETGYHIAKDFVAFASIPEGVNEEDIIQSDLILTKYNTIAPFYEYHATGEVAAYGHCDDGGLRIIYSPSDVYDSAINDLDIINELIKKSCSESDVQEALYKLCFFNAITTYEYYLSSILVSLVLGNERIFESFIHSEKITIELKAVSDKTCNIYKSIIHYIEYYNYHDTKKLKKLFKKSIGIEVTELGDLSYYIELRNSIAHRNGHAKYSEVSGKDHFTWHDANDAVIKVKDIITNINNKLQPIIMNWSKPSFTLLG